MLRARLLAIVLSTLMCGVVAHAQTTFASITGTVTDPSGLAIPGARLEATQLESGYKYQAQTNEAGVYTLADLRAGTYDLMVIAGGFKDSQVKGIQLVSRDVRRLDVAMQIGQVSTTVEVSGGGATLIETETARISQTRNASEMEALPLNTRSLTAFLSLSPGVGTASTVTATRRYAGSRRNQSDVSVDGVSTTASNGTQISPLTNYIESFSEARVDMANNTAEAAPIGEVTVVSKSGTNDLHGTVFDYYVTPMFRARDPFASQRGSGISHRPGGSIGGPVVIPHLYNGHNRTFFYASYETSQGSITQQLLNPSVPLDAWRKGDFSALLPGTVIKDPSTGKPIQGNMIPGSQLNQTALKIQDLFYPHANYGNTSVFTAANYREIVTHPFDPNNYWTSRIDHRFGQKAFVYGRYTWQRQNNTDFDANLPTIGRIYDQRNTRQMLISWTETLSTQSLNELRYGYAFSNEPRYGAQNGPAVVNELGLKGLLPNLPDLPGLPNIAFSGLGLTTITQQVYRSPGFYNRSHFLQDHYSWFRGKHSIKAGAQITRYDANDVSQSANLFGNMTFGNRYTGFPYADFLLGIPTTARRAGPALDSPFNRMAYDFFVTDEYKITPKLTLSLGVRYELHPFWSSGNNLSSVFDIKSGAIVVPDGSTNQVSSLLPANYVKVIPASQAGYSGTSLLTTDKNNIAPRVSAAWRPFGDTTVIRAGFGIFYDVVPAYVNMAGVPFSISEPAYNNPATNPDVILPVVFPASSVAGPTTVSLPTAFKKDLRIPYSVQYNLTIERQIAKMGVRLSYIATGTRQGEYAYNYNQPLASTATYISKPRAFPQFTNFNFVTNGAGHQYNSLNLEVKRRFASGLLYDFSWVWARDIGDLEGGNVPSNTLEYQAPENAYDLHRERTVWEDIPTHRVTGDFIYALPFGKGKRWLNGGRLSNLVFGGWELSAIYAFSTGQFLTPLWTGNDPTGTFNTSSSTPAQVTIRPNISSDPNLPSSQQSVAQWFNVKAFGPPTPGQFGTSSKGVIVGPSEWIIDSGLAKNFVITERVRLRGEFSGTNILNHPNWGNPGLNITSIGAAGVITNTGYGNGTTGGTGLDSSGARAFRLGLRLEF